MAAQNAAAEGKARSEEASQPEKETWPGRTLTELAKQKCLAQSLMGLYGVHQATYRSDKHTDGKDISTVQFPYGFWKDGKWTLTAVKVRGGSSHQTFCDIRTPDKKYAPLPFGFFHPEIFDGCTDLVICEAESDAITLTVSGFPAIGISGAQAWHDSFADLPPVKKAEAIFISCEPGGAGAGFAEAVISGLEDWKKEIWVIPFPRTAKTPARCTSSPCGN